MDTVMCSIHELLGFGELFDDQKFTSQRAPDIYPPSLLDDLEHLEDLLTCSDDDGCSTGAEDCFTGAEDCITGAEDCITKPIEEEEDVDVDVETVDDNPCDSIRATLSNGCETNKATGQIPHDQDISRSIFNMEGFGKFDDSFSDDYLAGFCGIEADDLDTLLQQFDSASKAMDDQNANAPQAAQLPAQHMSVSEVGRQLLHANPWDCLVDFPVNTSAGVSSTPEATESISGPLQLSTDYFDQISDHIYCLTQRADVQVKQEPIELVGSVRAADIEVAALHQQDQQPLVLPVSSKLAGDIRAVVVGTVLQPERSCDSKIGHAAFQETCSNATAGRAKSLLRPNATIKQAATTLSTNVLQAAIYSASLARSSTSCPAATRPSRGTSARKLGALSSTATTSQSSSSDSGSDCEHGNSKRQARTRCRSNSRSCVSNSRSCRSRDSRRHRSRSESSSSRSSRSRSRSRSRSSLRSHSSRQQQEKERQEDKQRAMAERRVVYVGNIPSNFTKTDLRRRFSGFGEIEDVSVHFRDRGDNYGFVTFADSCDAYAAIEKGNDVPGRQFKLCFGGRRIFCETDYADLDGCAAIKEEWALRSCRRRDDFESLLKQNMSRIKKK